MKQNFPQMNRIDDLLEKLILSDEKSQEIILWNILKYFHSLKIIKNPNQLIFDWRGHCIVYTGIFANADGVHHQKRCWYF